ncbi:MAG: hypothetical protein QM784_29170 [Polyangiaceae bacterium]
MCDETQSPDEGKSAKYKGVHQNELSSNEHGRAKGRDCGNKGIGA